MPHSPSPGEICPATWCPKGTCNKNHLFVLIANDLEVARGWSPIHEEHAVPQRLILPCLSSDGAGVASSSPSSPPAEATGYEFSLTAAVEHLLLLLTSASQGNKPLVEWKMPDLLNFPLETGYEVTHRASPLLDHGH